jgi:hypothetical protein
MEPISRAPTGRPVRSQLLRDDELESYLDGRARRITMDSIHRRITRLLVPAQPAGGLRNTKTGEEFPSSGGLHIVIPVRDAERRSRPRAEPALSPAGRPAKKRDTL